jgi:transposase
MSRADRHTHTPTDETREQVMILVGNGTNNETIARVLRISKRTLQRHYKTELAVGRDMAIASATSRLWALVQRGDLNAIKYWLCNRAGWKTERTLNELNANVSEPARVNVYLPDNGRS